MRFIQTITILIFVLALSASASTYNMSTVNEIGPFGDTEIRTVSEYPSANNATGDAIGAYIPPAPDSGEIWHYSVTSGLINLNVAIGEGGDYVFSGGTTGANMFDGIGGDGTPDWTTAETYSTGVTASETSDIYYAIRQWETKADNTEVSLYNHGSATPLWTYTGTGTFVAGNPTNPGKYDCSDDGTVLAVSGTIDGHLAIQFFTNTSSVPFQTYEDASIAYPPRQLRLTADGSKCLFRVSATLYRVDVATGVLEDDYGLGAGTDCFGVSADGSVVAYGFTAARVATWDGSSYSQEWAMSTPGYYGGAAAVADDNSTIYFGFYKSDYLSNRIYRHDISSSTPAWTYNYPTGSGGHQDIVEWMDCSNDGRWLAVASWGCQSGGGPEIEVFDDNYPTSPNFTIDTPGSMFHINITPDGQYIAATGKHVHANQMGSGTDVYFAEIEENPTGEDDNDGPNTPNVFALHPAYPNPANDAVTFSFALPRTGPVTLDIFDVKGRKVDTVLNEELSAGDYEVGISTDNLAGGVYLYRLTADDDSAVKKMVVK